MLVRVLVGFDVREQALGIRLGVASKAARLASQVVLATSNGVLTRVHAGTESRT